MPPNDKDFEMLEKTAAKPKTNMKGEPRKNEKSKAKSKIQFPMRTIPISKELLKYVQEFFESYDFILLMFLASVTLFAVICCLTLVPNDSVQNLVKINITFYALLFLLLYVMFCSVKDTFNLGLTRFSDQTKM